MEDFYHQKHIFVTGGSGFIGKALIEKTLRSIPSISQIYVLIRPKKGISAQSRLEKEIIDSPIFDRLRSERVDFDAFIHSKLVAITGDICAPDLGIVDEERQLLEQNVEIVVHGAATVQFNESLDIAVEMNCLGALRVYRLAQRMKKLQAYVHISTAYVNSNKNNCRIREELYPLEFDANEALDAIVNATPPELDKLHLNLIGTYPNTYTLTKSMTEHIICQERGDIPTVIFRPTIVGAAWREPVPGWVDQVAAAGAIFLAGGFGILTVLPGNPRSVADIIPVDMVVNSILISAYDIAMKDSVSIVHCGTSDPRENPLRWRVAVAVVPEYWRKFPPKRAIAPCTFTMIPSHQMYQIQWFLRYALPSSAYSTVANASGNPKHMKNAARLWQATWKSRTISEAFKPFTENEWVFSSDSMMRLRGILSKRDAENFSTKTQEIVWERYLQNFCFGLSKWMLQDDDLVPVEDNAVSHTKLALNTGRILEWDPDHHAISFPGLFSDISWAYTSSRKPGYTKSGVLGRFMGLTGWKEGANHEASYVERPRIQPLIEVYSRVLHSEDVQKAIQQAAESSRLHISEVEDKAERIIRDMAATVDYKSIRKLGWILRKIFRQMYEEIQVDESGLEAIRELVRNRDCPLVLVPTHRSYIDFLLLSYLFFAYNIPVPFIAAGEDFKNMLGLSGMLRDCGAYFIRRQVKDDPLYSAILSEYTSCLLSDGHTLEFYIEGTRSRSGKQLAPKFGMLSNIVKAFQKSRISQAFMVPISIDYERPVELSIHQKEVLGEEKIPESLSALLKSAHILRKSFGCIAVNFGKPIGLKEFLGDKASTDLKGSDAEVCHKIVEDLGYCITDAMTSLQVCMPIHLVATVLLMYRNGILRQQLINTTDWLRMEILHRGGQVHCVQGARRTYCVNRALKLLNHLVKVQRKDLLEPAITQREDYGNMISLGYYRNKLLHLFAYEGIMACAYYSLAARASTSGPGPQREDLVRTAMFLFEMFEKEFVHTRPLNLEKEMANVLDIMIDRCIFQVHSDGVSVCATGQAVYSLLCSFMWPFIDSYYVAVMSLFALQSKVEVLRFEFIGRMQWLAETMYHEKIIAHYESCSLETLQNALSVLEQWNVVQVIRSPKGKSVQVSIRLSPEYHENAKTLEALASRINHFRKLPVPQQGTNRLHEFYAELPVLAKL